MKKGIFYTGFEFWGWIAASIISLISIFILLKFGITLFQGTQTDKDEIEKTDKIEYLKSDTLKYSLEDTKNHNQQLITYIENLIQVDGNQIAVQEDIKRQVRLFYAAIVAGLIAFLFSKEDKTKRAVYVIIIFLIILMYLLEVHLHDYYIRYNSSFRIKQRAVETLISSNPSDLNWYVVNKESLKKYYSDMVTERVGRKLSSAINPDAEKFAFYIIPLMIFSGYIVVMPFKRKKNQLW